MNPPPPYPRSPDEEAAIREHHEDEYRSGLDDVDSMDDEGERAVAAAGRTGYYDFG